MLSSVRHYPRRDAAEEPPVTVTTALPAGLDLMPGVEPTPLALLLLGRSSDPASERGVDCPGDLPAASDPTLVARARAAKEALGDRVFVLGHHYQRDEVIAFADVTGDSFKLAQQAAARPEAEFIVFAGCTSWPSRPTSSPRPSQKVLLPTSRRLLDGRHGDLRPGRAVLGGPAGRRASPT
jgi:quinolinate synthase